MPTDAELEDEISVRYQTVSLEDVRVAVDRASGVRIMILDACRNNPIVDGLKRKMLGLSRNIDLTRGLARIDKTQGTQGIVVAYATAADEVASDGPGRNSPFTAALLKRLQEPGLEIGKLFRRVAADVNEMTHGQQRPEIYVSLVDEYFLNQKDAIAWEQIKDSGDLQALRDFVANFPSSPRLGDARYRVAMLEQLAREKQFEKERAEQEALRARLAEAERAEREAAQHRQAEEAARQLAAKQTAAPQEPVAAKEEGPLDDKLDAAMKQAASRLSMLEQLKLERERVQREVAGRQEADEQRVKPRDEPQQQAMLPPAPAPAPAPPAQPKAEPTEAQDQACKRDQERLIKLRAKPAADEIERFERELGCAKLRPQLVRLRESLEPADSSAARAIEQTPEPARNSQPKLDATPQANGRGPSAAATPAPSANVDCKRDEEKLTKLRANPLAEDIVRFEHELGCERLRPQVVRLKESVIGN